VIIINIFNIFTTTYVVLIVLHFIALLGYFTELKKLGLLDLTDPTPYSKKKSLNKNNIFFGSLFVAIIFPILYYRYFTKDNNKYS